MKTTTSPPTNGRSVHRRVPGKAPPRQLLYCTSHQRQYPRSTHRSPPSYGSDPACAFPPKMLLDELNSQLFAREQKNKIWTEIQVCAPITPRYLLDGNFSAALKAAPCIAKWIIICSARPTDPSLRDIRCARYPSDNLSEHVLLVSKLRSLYLQDRTVLTSMSVLDSRTEIVGDRAQMTKIPYQSSVMKKLSANRHSICYPDLCAHRLRKRFSRARSLLARWTSDTTNTAHFCATFLMQPSPTPTRPKS